MLIGGLDSTKEEYRPFEEICHRRGLATFAFDGPGQGEAFFDVKLRPDFERYTSAVLNCTERRPELDPDRFGAVVRSLGGHYAARSAAADPRFRAGISWGIFYNMSEFDDMPVLTQIGFSYVTAAESFEEGRSICRGGFDLGVGGGSVRIPYYVLQGRHDRIFSERQTKMAVDALAQAQLEAVVEADGDHCCHNMTHIVAEDG